MYLGTPVRTAYCLTKASSLFILSQLELEPSMRYPGSRSRDAGRSGRACRGERYPFGADDHETGAK